MSKKDERLGIIRKLIETETVSSQEELSARLREIGLETTQSTLSRDIKELRAVKVPCDTKGYMYTMPEHIKTEQRTDSASSVITENILSINFSGNMAVIKTRPGYANAVTVMIDGIDYGEIIGTIAGDDSILIVLREGASQSRLLEALSSIYPTINTLYTPPEKKSGRPLRKIFK